MLSSLSLAALAFLGCGAPDVRPFGRASLYVLRNAHGLEARITSYGAILTALYVPDRDGRTADVVLGFDRLAPYLASQAHLGAVVGRVANRIANARFMLDGTEYVLAANDGPNHLHGDLDKVVWDVAAVSATAVELHHRSPDGDEGYPGAVDFIVRYTLTDTDELRIDMIARTDRTTPINLVHHAYWNLAAAGDILDHELAIAAASYTPVDGARIPTGELAPVAGTAFDFRAAKPIRRDLPEGGYDHNFALDGAGLRFAARLADPSSGRVMEVWTNQPGLQLYTGNWLERPHQGLCLETQAFPDAIHHPEWHSVLVHPGETYHHIVVHKFSAK